MNGAKIVGVILIVLGLVIAFHAITIFDSDEYKGLRILGETPIQPWFEVAVAILSEIVGVWLLLRKEVA